MCIIDAFICAQYRNKAKFGHVRKAEAQFDKQKHGMIMKIRGQKTFHF